MQKRFLNDVRFRKLSSNGPFLAIIGAFLLSFDPIYIRLSGVSGFDTIFLFGLFTAISMSVIVQATEKRTIISVIRSGGWPLVFCSLLMLGSASAFVLSIKNTAIANTFIIQSATPAVVAFLSWLLLKERTHRYTWRAILLVIIGVTIVVNGSIGSGHWKGDLLALVSVFCVALIFTIIRKHPDINRMALVGLGGFFLAVVMFFFAKPSTFSSHTWMVMGAMGLVSAPLGRVLGMTATRFSKAAEVSLLLMLQNVIAPALAFLFFKEIPSQSTVIGGTVILITIGTYTLSLFRATASTKKQS